MNEPAPEPQVIGIAPWLPWPLSAWSWWTVPVPAERLAMLRIGVALCLLFDVAFNYAPEALAYFSRDGVGDPTIFNWRFNAPRMSWSLLRGIGDTATIQFAFVIGVALTGWMFFDFGSRLILGTRDSPTNDRTGFAMPLWCFALAVYVIGQWTTMIPGKYDDHVWLLPFMCYSVLTAIHLLSVANRLRDPAHPLRWPMMLFSTLVFGSLGFLGFWLTTGEPIAKSADWMNIFRSWQNEHGLTTIAMGLWLATTGLLLVGFMSRFMAIAAWLLSMSFANANPYLDNAGDTIRLILQFYLMLSPCGAAWSVDALLARRKAPVYVHPWPIRLIFVQMIFVYFMNGLYKLFGESWLNGYSLYYVLGDLTLTRFARTDLPLPVEVTQLMTWTVLTWEVTFPLLILWKWTRVPALILGVSFHLGIFLTMELGGFVPYALCMYLPLLPWERLFRRSV